MGQMNRMGGLIDTFFKQGEKRRELEKLHGGKVGGG